MDVLTKWGKFQLVKLVHYSTGIDNPVKEAVRPHNWVDIADGCAPTGEIGHFASVAVASADDPFDPTGDSAVPLYRGHAMHVRYEGLQ